MGVTRQHLENMSVRQAKIHDGDTGWYIVTGNGFIARGPFGSGPEGKELAEHALEQRRREYEEDPEA